MNPGLQFQNCNEQQLTFPPHWDIFPIERYIFQMGLPLPLWLSSFNHMLSSDQVSYNLQGHKSSAQLRGDRTTCNIRWAHILQMGAELEVHLRGARHQHSTLPMPRVLLVRVKMQRWTLRSQTASLSNLVFNDCQESKITQSTTCLCLHSPIPGFFCQSFT